MTNLQDYLEIKTLIDRVETVSDAEWQTRYAFDKIIPQLLKDGFDAEDIIKYLTIKVHESINKIDNIEVNAEEIKAK
jgi:predicted metal-dependent phosphotriesterase family hydrolase|tara:strand:- start:268 stop:498 length:231 start_codon:yes stop_codon:yes gene_type:complete